MSSNIFKAYQRDRVGLLLSYVLYSAFIRI